MRNTNVSDYGIVQYYDLVYMYNNKYNSCSTWDKPLLHAELGVHRYTYIYIYIYISLYIHFQIYRYTQIYTALYGYT